MNWNYILLILWFCENTWFLTIFEENCHAKVRQKSRNLLKMSCFQDMTGFLQRFSTRQYQLATGRQMTSGGLAHVRGQHSSCSATESTLLERAQWRQVRWIRVAAARGTRQKPHTALWTLKWTLKQVKSAATGSVPSHRSRKPKRNHGLRALSATRF